MVGAWTALFGLAWALTLSLFLFFNRDRMRMGDLIAGTWVVMATRARLDRDIAADEAAQAIIFDDAELAVYGIYELPELELVLRPGDARTTRQDAAPIPAQIGPPHERRCGKEVVSTCTSPCPPYQHKK